MPYLPAALASIERQTFRDFDVHVWENGSLDGSAEEALRWIPARLPGRVTIGSPLNLGASFRALVDAACSEYIALMGADDVSLPQRLERQVAFLDATPAAAAVGSAVEVIDAQGAPTALWPSGTREAEIRWFARWGCPLYSPSVLLRREAVLAVGNFSPLRIGEDYDLYLRMSHERHLANLAEVLVQYRVHGHNLTMQHAGELHKLDEDIATSQADRLFPGLAPAEALQLRRKVMRDSRERVSWSDFALHRRAARLTARGWGKPDDYITSTKLYRQQQWELLRNYLLQTRLGPWALQAKRSLVAARRRLA